MIRYVFCGRGLRRGPGFALAASALAVAIIEQAFLGLPMAAVGGAELRPAGVLAAGVAAIGLPPLARRADEEQNTTAKPAAKAIPERSFPISRHVGPRAGWTAETEDGKMPIK